MIRRATTFAAAILYVSVTVAQNTEDEGLADTTVVPVIPIDGPTPSFAPPVPSPVPGIVPVDALPEGTDDSEAPAEPTNMIDDTGAPSASPGTVQATAVAVPPTGSGGIMGAGGDNDDDDAEATEPADDGEGDMIGGPGPVGGVGGATPEPIDAGVQASAAPGEDGTGSAAAGAATGGQDATATTGAAFASASAGEPAATDVAPETTDDGQGTVGGGAVAVGAGSGGEDTDTGAPGTETTATPVDDGAAGDDTAGVPDAVDDVSDPSVTEEASPDSDSDGSGLTDEDLVDASPSESVEGDDDDDICFPGLATVELEDGFFKTMRDLQIGDKVRVNANEFSPVFMFTHRLSNSEEHFVEITTQSGATIRATKSHYIPTADSQLVAAGSLKRGDTLFLADGSRSAIVSLKSVRDTGLYNPQTLHGDIAVNGVIASTFTKSVEPKLAKALLAPLRAGFSYFGVSLSFFETGSYGLAKLVPRGSATVRW